MDLIPVATAQQKTTRKLVHGFTLIEMMIVLAIVAIISTVLLINNSRFNSSILLRSFAYEVGLSIRQAQLYGIGVKELAPVSGVPNITNFKYSYGAHFDTPPTPTYFIFADINGDGTYDGSDAIVDTYSARNGFVISDICATGTAGEKCFSSTPTLTSLDIVFKRPDPNARIQTSIVDSYSSAKIVVKSPGGSSRSITVSTLGQISIVGTGN